MKWITVKTWGSPLTPRWIREYCLFGWIPIWTVDLYKKKVKELEDDCAYKELEWLQTLRAKK